MKHKTSRLVPNTLAQTLVVLEGCCMMFSEYVYNILMAVENIFYNRKVSTTKNKQVNHPKDSPITSRIIVMAY
jgi:hypothetical protein